MQKSIPPAVPGIGPAALPIVSGKAGNDGCYLLRRYGASTCILDGIISMAVLLLIFFEISIFVYILSLYSGLIL
jgi:hypothetical protein